MQKTIVVEVTRRVPHPVYKRIINKRNKFYAHDEQQRRAGRRRGRIIECRPMSKLKRWRLGEVLRKAVQVAVEPDGGGSGHDAADRRFEIAQAAKGTRRKSS